MASLKKTNGSSSSGLVLSSNLVSKGSRQMTVTYRKGPLGYAVSVEGNPAGAIRDIRQHGGWLVSVVGFRPGGDGLATAFSDRHVFKTVRAAKRAIETHFANRPTL